MAAPRRYREIAQRVVRLASELGLETGEPLPSERELAATLAISRTLLREALVALEIDGVVEVRGGAGIYLRGSVEASAPLGGPAQAVRELLAARLVVGPRLAALAARHAGDAATAGIRTALAAQRAPVTGLSDPDRELMLAIAGATGNAALLGVTDYLWRQAAGQDAQRPMGLGHALYEAIAARDEAGARRAMQAFLSFVPA
jgi:DNA-binding FadR family transcriptional regulator